MVVKLAVFFTTRFDCIVAFDMLAVCASSVAMLADCETVRLEDASSLMLNTFARVTPKNAAFEVTVMVDIVASFSTITLGVWIVTALSWAVK